MNSKPITLIAGILAATFFFAPSTWAEPVVRSQSADKDSTEGSENKSGVASQKDRKDREKGNKSGQRRGKRGAEMLIERFDSDGDGKLAVSELPDRMQKRFAKVDTDEDGFVDAEELKTAFGNRGGRDGKGKGKAGKGDLEKTKQTQREIDPARYLQRLDKDGDEKLSITEAPKRMQAGFPKADTNEDGFVDLKELTVVMEMLEEKRAEKMAGREQREKERRRKEDGFKPITPKAPPVEDVEL